MHWLSRLNPFTKRRLARSPEPSNGSTMKENEKGTMQKPKQLTPLDVARIGNDMVSAYQAENITNLCMAACFGQAFYLTIMQMEYKERQEVVRRHMKAIYASLEIDQPQDGVYH